MAQIHIGRGTTNLGVFEVEEIQAGLATGRFLLSDLGWKEGMEGWKPLSTFAELSNAPTHEPLLSTEPGEKAQTTSQGPSEFSGEGLPWEQRDQIGWAQAYLQTVKLVLTEPARAFSIMDQEGGLTSPLIFALIGGFIGGIAGLIYYQIFLLSPAWIAQTQQLPPQFRALLGASVGIGAIFWIPIKVVLGVFIGAGVLHLCLMLVGGAKRPFETTFRVICFCLGSTNLLLAIPLCGGVIAGVWGLIVQVIGLAKAHDIQTGRALTAVLLPLICCCAFITAAVFAVGVLHNSH